MNSNKNQLQNKFDETCNNMYVIGEIITEDLDELNDLISKNDKTSKRNKFHIDILLSKINKLQEHVNDIEKELDMWRRQKNPPPPKSMTPIERTPSSFKDTC
jgi:uncharacterized coiled-coil protein SlyX